VPARGSVKIGPQYEIAASVLDSLWNYLAGTIMPIAAGLAIVGAIINFATRRPAMRLVAVAWQCCVFQESGNWCFRWRRRNSDVVHNGILNLANWAGNVILRRWLACSLPSPSCALRVRKGYACPMYGGLLCLMASGLLRAMETFASQRAWNDPDVYWISLVSLVDWICNVLMPIYAGLQVTAGALRNGHRHADPSHGRMDEALRSGRALFAPIRTCADGGVLCFEGNWWSYLRKGKGAMSLEVTPAYRNLRTRVTFSAWKPKTCSRFSPWRSSRTFSEGFFTGRCSAADEHGPAIRRARAQHPGTDAVQYGKQRGYLQDWVMFHAKPHVYSALERDRELTREYLRLGD